MFSRAKKDDPGLTEIGDADAIEAPAAIRKASAKPAPRKSAPRPAGVPSLISADVVIRGAIESEGEVQFDGEIEGDLKAKGLVIGEGARVTGEVVAEKVRVSGTVEGSIRATRVELAAGSLVRGDVIHTALAIEAGAKFEGNVRHSDDPVGAAPAAAQRPSVSAPTGPAPTPAPAEADHQMLEMATPRERAPKRLAKADLR